MSETKTEPYEPKNRIKDSDKQPGLDNEQNEQSQLDELYRQKGELTTAMEIYQNRLNKVNGRLNAILNQQAQEAVNGRDKSDK